MCGYIRHTYIVVQLYPARRLRMRYTHTVRVRGRLQQEKRPLFPTIASSLLFSVCLSCLNGVGLCFVPASLLVTAAAAKQWMIQLSLFIYLFFFFCKFVIVRYFFCMVVTIIGCHGDVSLPCRHSPKSNPRTK